MCGNNLLHSTKNEVYNTNNFIIDMKSKLITKFKIMLIYIVIIIAFLGFLGGLKLGKKIGQKVGKTIATEYLNK